MTYETIYNKIEEFCNSMTPEEYKKLDNCKEIENLYTDLEYLLREEHEDLFWEIVDTGIDLLLEEDPWQFLEDFPTERDYIIYLLDHVDTLIIAEWIGFEFNRDKVIEEYLESHL